MPIDDKKVMVAVSGGVDSAVAAWSLKRKGYDVLGVFMRLGQETGGSERSARLLCQKLGLKFYPVNLSDKFNQEIISYFLSSYGNGETPNPCVKCNKLIKFGELFRLADYFGAKFLATGHYVSIRKPLDESGQVSFELHRGRDAKKDQSYFLYNLDQKGLSRLIFPLGESDKEEVRQIADREGLPYLMKESQDICFLNNDGNPIEHNDFLKSHIILKPGPIRELIPHDGASHGENEAVMINGLMTGRKSKLVGQHSGLPLYTLGQRKGVEIGGTGPYYVAGMDYGLNILYVVVDQNDEALSRKEFSVKDVNWISPSASENPLDCEVQIRYRQKPVSCSVIKRAEEKDALVRLKIAERAVTNGQSAVFYQNDKILGGGIIKL